MLKRFITSNSTYQKYGKDLWQSVKVSVKVAYEVAPVQLAVILALTLTGWIFPTLQTWAWRELLNGVTANNLEDFAVSESLIFWAVVVVSSALLDGITNSIMSHMRAILQMQLQLKVNVDTFVHAAKLDLSFFENPEFEDMISRSQGNIAGQLSSFLNSITNLIYISLQLISVTVLLFYIDGWAVFILVPVALPYIWFQLYITQAQYEKRILQTTRRRWLGYYTSCVMSRGLIPEVKINSLAPHLADRYRETLESINAEDLELRTKIGLRGNMIFNIAFTLAYFGMLAYAGLRVISGNLLVGDLAIYARTATQLRAFIQQATSLGGTIVDKLLYVVDWQIFMNTEPTITGVGTAKPDISGGISVRNVTFKYPNTTKTILHDVSFDIHPGETVAIVGENGSGKSTIVKLLTRLYAVEEGSITVDGHEISDIDLDHYHGQYSYIPQHFNRFEATVQENIAYGDWERLKDQPDEVKKLAKTMGIDDLINAMPEGYETQLGRKFGTYDLSGGQWQQIAIGRALIRNSKFIILDEPTSSLDVKIEHKIFSDFRRLSKDRTSILISHRFSTLAIADRLIVMHEGRVVEQGSHDELITKNGYYAAMYNLQKHEIETPAN